MDLDCLETAEDASDVVRLPNGGFCHTGRAWEYNSPRTLHDGYVQEVGLATMFDSEYARRLLRYAVVFGVLALGLAVVTSWIP